MQKPQINRVTCGKRPWLRLYTHSCGNLDCNGSGKQKYEDSDMVVVREGLEPTLPSDKAQRHLYMID